MAISELQLLQRESSRIRSGGTVQSPTQLLQTNLQKNASTKNEQNQKDTSFWGGVGYTLEKLGLGVLRGVEGVADFVVGGVADLFGGESGDEFAENVMKSDWVNYGHADEWYDAGETMSFVGDVASGIGNMLPAIAVNFIPGVGQAASAAISTATFATSAAGQATSDIVKETGELSGKEWLYGTASGALEAGIEYISGGIGGTAAGKGLAKAFGKTTLGKVAGNFIGEGLEEVASDIANPLLKRATGVDKNAGIDWKGLPRTFAVGGATGAVMGGGKRVIDAAKVGGFNNLNTIESAQELTERQADNNIRQIKGKSAIYTEQDIARTKENLSKRLRKMDDTTRAQFLKANSNIANQFNEDGTVKDFAPAPETYNEGTYSASLKGRESTLAYKPVAETSAESDVAKKVMKTLTKMTDGNTNIVLTEDALTTEDGQKANGLYKDGVIYLDAKATDYDKALTVGVHEVIHGLEGTKEYNDLASYIAETISKDPELAKKYSVEKYRAVYDKILEGEWTEATKDYQASTEIFADYLANKVVTNEKMLNNLVMRNSNVVVRFVNWVRNSIAKLGDDAEERLMRKGLKKLEKALGKALEAGTGGISLERVEELSKSAEKRLKTQDGNVQSVKFGENKNADSKLATARTSLGEIIDKDVNSFSQNSSKISSGRASIDVSETTLKEKRTMGSARFSLAKASEIAENQTAFNEKMKFVVDENVLKKGIESTARMVKLLSEHKDILPEDRIGKVLKSNSSYDKSVENTTICVRTLAYNEFIDMVSEEVGRPLTQAESFLVSQKLYEIAVDPQCLYCYVSLDRKAYNEFLIRYINERDEVMDAYKKSDKSKQAVEELCEKYRNKRKDTGNMRTRFDMSIEMAKKGITPLTAKEVSTKARQSEIASRNDYTSVQWKDMAAYAQSASWAKKQFDYVAYYNDILTLSQQAVNNLNKHYGLRFYSFSDYTAAFIVENMQQVTDAAIRGLKGLGYTKDTDFARIFAPTGMNINISMYAYKNRETGEWDIDPRQSANLDEAIALREKYPNVGIVVTATTDEGVEWALKQEWSDVVIPFHIVRTGADVAEFYKWQNYTTESADTIADDNLWKAYVNGHKKVSKNIYPAEHQNDRDTYFKLIKERGLKPRFERFKDNPNYMKLVNETRQSAQDTKPMQPIFDEKAAVESFNKFAGKGGYFKGWYKEGVDVKTEVKAVAKDVQAGKKANEVEYGRQDIDTEALMKKRTAVRTHSRASLDTELDKKTTERVQTVVSDEKLTLKERWENTVEKLKEGKADQWIKAQIGWTDEQAGILGAGKNVGVVLHGDVQRARSAKAAAMNMLNNEQRDFSGKKRVGDSLKSIFQPIQSRGEKVAQAFNLYLLHQLNVDRMSAESDAVAKRKDLLKKFPDLDNAVNGRYANDAEWQSAVSAVDGGKEYLATFDVENKAVFEKDVDKAFSQEKIQQLEKQYPEFKATAEKVWKYNQNLLQYRVDAGLITQAQADQMTKMYPHYVPAFYEKNGGSGTSGASVGNKGIAVRTGIKKAKGSTGVSDIKDVPTSIAKQTVAVIRAASINKIVEKMYDGAMKTKNFVDFEIVGKESMTDPDVNYDTDIPKENQVYFYKDGERITLDVTDYVYAGFQGLTAQAQLSDPLTSASAKLISLFKKAVTSWNPLFAATNAIRDVQEAFFYTKYGAFKLMGNYGKSLFMRKHDPKLKELWQQYVAMGGTGSGYFSNDTGVYDARNKVKKGLAAALEKFTWLNEWVEQTPRFAEFVASVEAGNSVEQALYDSAEVTTNFSRGGKKAKWANRHLVPFLNPSIQGWSKLWRSWVAPMDGKSAAEIEKLSKQSKGRQILSKWGVLIVKSVAVGISVGLFNDMLYRWIDEDEDYANLPLNIKENYYLLKVGNKFIKIPKGRVVALYGSVATRISEAANGNEEALDAWSWYKSASEMVSPLESASRTIFAPFYDVATNTTWYGGQIESASMENLAPSERYDEGTSKIAIAIGKVLNKSPKKIHYILDQYSGVIGDVILPLTTNKAEKGMFSSRFVVDPVYNNDISTKYYDYKEELTFAKNSGDTNAKLMLKYMNEVQDALSKMYQQKRDIANDKSLTNKEKREQTEIVQSLINATLSSSVDMADEFEQLLINSGFEQAVSILGNNATYKKMDEKARNSAYNKLVDYYYNVCLSRLNNTKVDTKYTLYGAINATDIVVYLTDINNIESDTDKKGNVIQGSRKEKVQKYIQGLKLTAQQKYILSYLAGYAPTDNGKSAISKYLKNNGYTQKEINEIWN